jgi:hypothetical protein|tara:strand:+ start:1535 stop:2455 length:921 start_codon:yes stop_codon:yes gene_type:complete
MAEEQIVTEEQYETEVKFYNRYNHGATAMMRPGLVDMMNDLIDNLYETRYEELYHQNAYREVTGRQVSMPSTELPEEMSHFILNMARGYLLNSGLHFMDVDYSKIPLEIDKIWTTDSKENDYIANHSHFGLVAGVMYLKVPPQVAEFNDEGKFYVHHDEPGFTDVNPLTSIRPKGTDLIIPEEGKMTVFPAWLKHSVSPFYGPGIRRAASFNVICPEHDQHKYTVVDLEKDFIGKRRKVEEVLKIDTAGGPDAKIQGDGDLSNVNSSEGLKPDTTDSPTAKTQGDENLSKGVSTDSLFYDKDNFNA